MIIKKSKRREGCIVDATFPTNLVFCKFFGQHGTPKYGCGGQTFPEFLKLMSNDPDISLKDSQYYQSCIKVKLER